LRIIFMRGVIAYLRADQVSQDGSRAVSRGLVWSNDLVSLKGGHVALRGGDKTGIWAALGRLRTLCFRSSRPSTTAAL
jgi:hypothetical protein